MFITVDASTTIILNTKHHYETTQGVSYRDREPIHSSTTYQDVFQGIGKPFNPKLLERNDNDYLPLSPSTKTSRMAIPTLWHEPFIQSPDTIKEAESETKDAIKTMMIENGKFTKQSLLPIADTDLLQPGFTRGEVQLLKSPGCKASDNCVTIHDANVVAKSVPPLKMLPDRVKTGMLAYQSEKIQPNGFTKDAPRLHFYGDNKWHGDKPVVNPRVLDIFPVIDKAPTKTEFQFDDIGPHPIQPTKITPNDVSKNINSPVYPGHGLGKLPILKHDSNQAKKSSSLAKDQIQVTVDEIMRAERHVIQPHPSNIKHREPKQNVQLVELRDECGIAVRGNTEIVVDNKKIVSVSEQMDNYKWRGWSEGSTALLPAISVAKVSTTRLRS